MSPRTRATDGAKKDSPVDMTAATDVTEQSPAAPHQEPASAPEPEMADAPDERATAGSGTASPVEFLQLKQSALLRVLRNLERSREDRPQIDDPEFVPMRDNDRILSAGTVVTIGGVKAQLLIPTPILAPELANEQHFVELIAHEGENLQLNLPYLMNRYNRAGQLLGENPENPVRVLQGRIDQLGLEIIDLLEEQERAETTKAD